MVTQVTPKQKLYCYVDESGQDAGSDLFIVVAVIAWSDVEKLRSSLVQLEKELGIGSKKWHKLRPESRSEFMQAFLKEKHSNLRIYFRNFKKPTSYYFSTLDSIQKSLADFPEPVEAIINIDGLDGLSAKKMTNALRSKNLRLKLVKGQRDESEVLIRLADRWAGCLRQAFLDNNTDCKEFIVRAKKKGVLKEL